ncbi:hypothetical protein GF345_05175, partial [Candidatus Woesearchaeota archaeon]|nr:hypothetical protein [Candidatus Woesearchaeota archaeon]
MMVMIRSGYKKIALAGISLALLAVSMSSALAAPLDFVLEPLARFDVAGTYARFGFIIDALIYFMILLGAAEVALRKQ